MQTGSAAGEQATQQLERQAGSAVGEQATQHLGRQACTGGGQAVQLVIRQHNNKENRHGGGVGSQCSW
jgi:hypothetical protein